MYFIFFFFSFHFIWFWLFNFLLFEFFNDAGNRDRIKATLSNVQTIHAVVMYVTTNCSTQYDISICQVNQHHYQLGTDLTISDGSSKMGAINFTANAGCCWLTRLFSFYFVATFILLFYLCFVSCAFKKKTLFYCCGCCCIYCGSKFHGIHLKYIPEWHSNILCAPEKFMWIKNVFTS